MIEKTLDDYAHYMMYKVWKGERPLSITVELWSKLKKEHLPTLLHQKVLPPHIRELFVIERWRKSEALYRPMFKRRIRDPVLALYLYELRSAVEEWYIINGFHILPGRYDINLQDRGRNLFAILTPRKDIIFFDSVPHLVPPGFSLYQHSIQGEHTFLVYQGRLVSGLVPYIFHIEGFEAPPLSANLLR